jgi:hypothetical protein
MTIAPRPAVDGRQRDADGLVDSAVRMAFLRD